MKIKKVIGRILYEFIAKHLPASVSFVNIGQKPFRAWCARLIAQSVGKGVNIEKGAVFYSDLTIGDYSGIGINSAVHGECHIGKNVMMGPDCIIYTRNHRFDDTGIPMCEQGFSEDRPVYIGDDVWIGGRVIILPGVKVGDHAIIGAGSVVTKDVPSWAIAAGNPAAVKKYRKKEVLTEVD